LIDEVFKRNGMVEMNDISVVATIKPTWSETSAAVFQEEWRVYQKMVDHDYLFHRNAYRRLHAVLTIEAPRPFRFLDLACGDAICSSKALSGTEVANYCGVDLSNEALQIASRTLRDLPCPATLVTGDFAEALATTQGPVDVIWIGLSLHHLRQEAKLAAMRAGRRLLNKQGMLLVYENTSPDGEDRAGWLQRWDQQERDWTGLEPHEWKRIATHVHACDFPETVSNWRALGRKAGFSSMTELFVAPTNLFRLLSFRTL
jgi:ubiquinone/menaquinone biosynthesis C-methylase UbiE